MNRSKEEEFKKSTVLPSKFHSKDEWKKINSGKRTKGLSDNAKKFLRSRIPKK